MLQMIKYENLAAFKDAVIPFLEQDEVANGLLLGLLQKTKTLPILNTLGTKVPRF
jgi:hypothetical protein